MKVHESLNKKKDKKKDTLKSFKLYIAQIFRLYQLTNHDGFIVRS